MTQTLLEIKNLTVAFNTDEGSFNAVENLNLKINQGEIVGLVGESGCGKSVTALSIIRLIPRPPATFKSGGISFQGQNLLDMPSQHIKRIRGAQIGIIFQEPSAALSPLHRIGNQLVEALKFHQNMKHDEAWNIAQKWLKKVNIPDAKNKMFAYPHQLSGGMQQRVMIAMTLMLEPDLIIADEPTTALDVTIQAQIFELIRDMKNKNTAILLITHDMGVVWEMCDRVSVMYASRIVEEGLRQQIFKEPAHPYTQGLLASIPTFSSERKKLQSIMGQVPSPYQYPKGCRFNDRCPHVFEKCKELSPPYTELSKGHKAACFLAHPLTQNSNHA